jgi:tripartite motif-containing protein 71
MGSTTFYPAGSEIAALTSVNDAAVRYLLDKSDCPYKVIGKEGQYCTTTPPTAPTGLVATAFSSSQVNLTWTDSDSTEQGFKLERCTGAGCSDFAQIAAVSANVTSYSNTGLTASTSYSYRVRAYNAAGESDYSTPATAVTQAAPALPAAPTNLVATAVSRSQVNLTWTDNSSNETGFKIERCKGATCTNFTQIVTVGVNVTSYANTGLNANTTYRYRVRAYNASDNSAYSNIAAATTPRR